MGRARRHENTHRNSKSAHERTRAEDIERRKNPYGVPVEFGTRQPNAPKYTNNFYLWCYSDYLRVCAMELYCTLCGELKSCNENSFVPLKDPPVVQIDFLHLL
jgi:hypothetical protein